MTTPGTWRVSTGEAVNWPEAVAAWVQAALPVLVRTAGSYGAYIKYAELAEQVQVDAGIRTKVLLPNWIGEVLGAAANAQAEGEPMLTALVVHSDGTIGDGYGIPVGERDGVVPDDLDMHAATERLACYRYFGAEIPADGGIPTLTTEVAARRKRAKPAPARAVCPGCNLRLPASGCCDNCG